MLTTCKKLTDQVYTFLLRSLLYLEKNKDLAKQYKQWNLRIIFRMYVSLLECIRSYESVK